MHLGIMLSSCLGLFGPKSHMRMSVCFGCVFLILFVRREVCVCLLWNLIVWKAFLMHDSLLLF